MFQKRTVREPVNGADLERRLKELSERGIKIEYMQRGAGNGQWVLVYQETGANSDPQTSV